jgi:aminomethyltransferase
VVYRRAKDHFFVVVNASNTEKDYLHLKGLHEKAQRNGLKVQLSNESASYTQVALQGRRALEILQKLTDIPLAPIRTYWFGEGKILRNIDAIIARTGYTGEDGFEIYVPWDLGPQVWRSLLEVGAPLGLKPCGLGARDTLRTEMKYPLYGHELSDTTNPLEAGLGWVVKLDKTDFVGKDALVSQKERGKKRALVGIKLLDRKIPRQGYPILTADGSRVIGEVTSGTQSPSLKEAIGIAYIETAYATKGTNVAVEIRGIPSSAIVVETPFYKRPY